MEAIEQFLSQQTQQARERRVLGLVTAIVKNMEDDGTYRLRYLSMGSDDADDSAPARVMMPMAGGKRGMHFFPQPGDEVVVGFELGDPSLPVILGGVWNNNDPPPDQAKRSSENHIRTIVSRSGHEITLDDTPGMEKVTVRSKGGHQLALDDTLGLSKVTLKSAHGQAVTMDDTSNSMSISGLASIKLQAASISLNAATIDLTTTGSIPASAVVIDGKPFGVHMHVVPADPTKVMTGPVFP